jgi:hypothetical protein
LIANQTAFFGALNISPGPLFSFASMIDQLKTARYKASYKSFTQREYATLLSIQTISETLEQRFPRRCGSNWQCNCCSKLLRAIGLQVHACKPANLDLQQLKYNNQVRMDKGGLRCGLCNMFVDGGADEHSCHNSLFTSVLFDMTDVLQPKLEISSDDEHIIERLTKTLRSCAGHVCIVMDTAPMQQIETVRTLVQRPGVKHLRYHAILCKGTRLDADGYGVLATFDSNQRSSWQLFARRQGAKLTDDSYSYPVLNHHVFCAYTGVVTAHDPGVNALASLHATHGNFWIDPTKYGGVGYLLNHSHNGNGKIVEVDDRVYVVRTVRVACGDELCYDYNAISDDPNDGQIMCNCGCGERLYTVENK